MLAKRLFRSGLTLLAVFAVVWMATIAWWQATHRMPTTADIVTSLFLLPLGMVIGYRVIRRALDGTRTNVAAGRELAATTAPVAATAPQRQPTRRTPPATGAPRCSAAPSARPPAPTSTRWSKPRRPTRSRT